MKHSYTLSEALDKTILELRDKCVKTGSIKNANQEFHDLVREAEERQPRKKSLLSA